MEKAEEEVGGVYFKGKSTGENHKLGVIVVSHWLSCRGSQFLIGGAMDILPFGGL